MEIINILQYALLAGAMCLTEYAVFGLWYKIFIKSNVGYTKFVRKMVGHYCSQIFHLPGSLYENAPEGLSMTFVYAMGMPFFAAMFILLIDNWIIRVIFFCVPASVIFEKLFLEEKQKRAAQIHKWIQYLYSLHHQRQKEVNKADKEEADYKTAAAKSEEKIPRHEDIRDKIIGIPLMIVIMALLVVVILGGLDDLRSGKLFAGGDILGHLFSNDAYNHAFFILLAIFFVLAPVFLFSDKSFREETAEEATEWTGKKYRKMANLLGWSHGILVDPLLAEWEESVFHMCAALKIRHVTVLSEKSIAQNFNGKLAIASRDDDGIPIIVLSIKAINQMRVDNAAQTVHNMALFLIGHELAHIHYKDFSERLIAFKRLKSLALVVASMYVLWYVYPRLEAIPILSIGCLWFFVLFWIFCLLTFMKAEYWYFLREFRADRVGANISGVSFNEIEYLLRLENKSQKRTPDNGVIKNVSRKIIGQPTHPGSERRLYELTRKQGWDLFEYIRYAVLFLFQRIR
ncbi:MAG: M48 family metalloprotease [Clostridiales bacterium]|nr:M48 family metalloprotease [Clostridiales bacterium]